MTDKIAYINGYLHEAEQIFKQLDRAKIADAIERLRAAKGRGGRLFVLGVGGSAANASHAVNDFRKIAGWEAYAPSDNVSELTAWINDNGFACAYVNWLATSRLAKDDALLVLSVGGGTQSTSQNLVEAMRYSRKIGASLVSIVSRDGGEALKLSDCCILIPVVCDERITAHAEGLQSVLCHLIVNAMR